MKKNDLIKKLKSQKIDPLWLDDYTELFRSSFLKNNFEFNSNHLLTIFNLQEKSNVKIIPIIHLAEANDADCIKKLLFETYKGTYPDKRYEDKTEFSCILSKKNYKWFKYELDNKIVGACGYKLNFKGKCGKSYGLVLKKEYRGKIDIKNTIFACMVYMYSAFKNKIIRYFLESRTQHPRGQSIANYSGLKPIAFFPNKDLLLKKPESSFLHVIYDQVAIKKFRTEEIPHIIPEIVDFYSYSN
ncbi:MAG: GNAT family N-acetyltransferase, partial [Promethearchaeota archaeon]